MASPPAPLLTRAQVRRIDQWALERYGIPGVILMENAGRHVAEAVRGLLAGGPAGSVAVVCGGGNNGGDGYVAARHLHNHGVRVALYSAAKPGALTGDAALNRNIVAQMGLPCEELVTPAQIDRAAAQWASAAVLVDALLGTGFSGQVREPLAGIIARCNALKGPRIVAVDVPSGLDCDTGQPAHACLRADLTITFVARKIGFDQPGAQAFLGQVQVADIGAPPELIEAVLHHGDTEDTEDK